MTKMKGNYRKLYFEGPEITKGGSKTGLQTNQPLKQLPLHWLYKLLRYFQILTTNFIQLLDQVNSQVRGKGVIRLVHEEV